MTNAEARFNKIHIRKVYACLAVTCHLHFWQNDRDFLRATVVTRGWNGYRNKSQHRKSTLEKKILPPFQQGFEPATFQSRVRCSNHWAIPAPINVHRSHKGLLGTGRRRYGGGGEWDWIIYTGPRERDRQNPTSRNKNVTSHKRRSRLLSRSWKRHRDRNLTAPTR